MNGGHWDIDVFRFSNQMKYIAISGYDSHIFKEVSYSFSYFKRALHITHFYTTNSKTTLMLFESGVIVLAVAAEHSASQSGLSGTVDSFRGFAVDTALLSPARVYEWRTLGHRCV